MAFVFNTEPLTLENLGKIYLEKPLLEIAPELQEKLNNYKAQFKDPDKATAEAFLAAHSLTFGPYVPETVTRLALVLQIYTLLLPVNQPVQPEIIQRLLAFHNREVWPFIPEQGLPISQQTQLCLPLLGQGKVSFQGYELNAADVMEIFSWQPLALTSPEAERFISQNTFTYAYLLHNLFKLQPILRWLEYLIPVFHQVAAEQPAALPADCKRLAETLDTTYQVIQHNYILPVERQNLPQVRDSVLDLLPLLMKVTAGITDQTSETYENLVSTSEPPATTSYTIAADLVQSLQKQLKLTVVNPTDAIILTKDMRILHHELSEALNLTEQVIALAFWSIAQVGRVYSLTPGNLTLSAYYHSVFFVPKERISDQLEKTINFIRITTPSTLT